MKKAALILLIGLGGYVVHSLACSWFLGFFRIV
jgi:hypothetical protein